MGAIKGVKLEAVTCPICGVFSSKRLTQFELHLKESHNTTPQAAWNNVNNGPILCRCGCLKEAPWHGWKNGYGEFIIGHNANVYSSYDETTAAALIKQRSDSLKGKTGWSKGLTKDTDERVKKRAKATALGRKAAFDAGEITIWSKGLTKESDPRIAAAAEALKADFASGDRVAWHSGLTEETDERVAAKNQDLRDSYASGDLTIWSKGKTAAEDPRIGKTWEHRDPVKEYVNQRFSDEEIRERLASNVNLTLEEIDCYRNIYSPSLVVRCRTCSEVTRVSMSFASNDRCPTCAPAGSIGQNDIADWLQSLGLNVGRNVHGIIGSKSELDIYVPQHKLAIEYNGLYWHNEAAGKGPKYHQTKTDRCKAIGISLIHVFEDEWLKRPNVIKSMIAHKLGLTQNRTHARRCTLVALSNQERSVFLDETHIDGDVPAQAAWGLKLGDTLVAAMSVRHAFHKKHAHKLEIARFATKVGHSVTGAMGRLTKPVNDYARAQNKTIIMTYVDTRLGGSGKGYELCGFNKTKETTPRFWWTNNRERFNRFKFKADKKRGMTEVQVADEAGIIRIYGCKNIVFELPV